jgi:hypothetical protein
MTDRNRWFSMSLKVRLVNVRQTWSRDISPCHSSMAAALIDDPNQVNSYHHLAIVVTAKTERFHHCFSHSYTFRSTPIQNNHLNRPHPSSPTATFPVDMIYDFPCMKTLGENVSIVSRSAFFLECKSIGLTTGFRTSFMHCIPL